MCRLVFYSHVEFIDRIRVGPIQLDRERCVKYQPAHITGRDALLKLKYKASRYTEILLKVGNKHHYPKSSFYMK
jgi:hypothetical protein